MNKIEFEVIVFNQRILDIKQNWIDSLYVNICVFDSIFDNHNISGLRGSREYKRLSMVHCLDFDGMEHELNIEIDKCFSHLVSAMELKFNDKVFWYKLFRGKL